MVTFEKIINAYAIAKICTPDITMQEVEELYSKYETVAYEEYNKLHKQDSLAECSATDKPF